MEDGLTCLSAEAFRGCISLAQIELPSTLTERPPAAFRECSALTDLTLPSGIKRIGERAFYECTRLTSVVLELGVERIDAFAFAKNPRMTHLTVPHTLKRLGFGAFGLGNRQEKLVMYVDNEYMLRRMKRQLLLCGSRGCVEVLLTGKSIEERKRERRRTTIEKTPTHLVDFESTDSQEG